MDLLIITVAGVGAELTAEQQPNLPVTPEQVGADAARCQAAGASIYHLHVRDASGFPTMSIEAFAQARDAITQNSDLIVQFTSGGAVTDTEGERIAPLDLRPEMASLTTGTVNFGSGVFWNPRSLIDGFYRRMRELGIVPEFEIFEPGMIATAVGVASEADHHLHFDLVLGVPGAMPAWDDSVSFLSAHLPEGSTWSATGIGRAHIPVAEQAIELGGHVRTGFEDVRYLAPGELATSNAQLIARVAAMGRDRGREVATPDQARSLLGLERSAGTLAR
ncbi:MAG: 3-keto-5-aminohexanoate cleavage protein [Actinobacteria bacterium]|nr:3-keto-5-aminohexanoate cleavage protein [Actinomycetota bacterium]